MYNKVLVAMSLEHGIGRSALKIAQKLVEPNGEIVAVHVHEAPQPSVRSFIDEEIILGVREKAIELLEERVGGQSGVKAILLTGHGARTLIEYASDNAVDCIVMGSHKPGLQDHFLGSTASRVVRHANCAVHVVRESV